MSNQTTTPRTREELVNRFTWNYGRGGHPGPEETDLPSTVFLCGDPAKYTDEELSKLAAFADEKDRRYDAAFNCRRGCNAIIFEKIEKEGDIVAWRRRRLTWESGPMVSKTLDAAIEVFTKDWKTPV